MLAQHLGEREHEVGGGRSRGQRAAEAHADHDRRSEICRLPQHRRLGFDAADPPSEHAEPIDHGRMRVGAHERVGDGDLAALDFSDLHDLGDVLEVHLVADAHARWHQREVVERLLGPPQQRIAFAVALDLLLDVACVSVAETERVDLDRVVDDEVDRDERIHLARVFARALHRRPHRRQVHHRGHAGEVLHKYARGEERQLGILRRGRRPGRERAHALVVRSTRLAHSQQALEEDLDRHRQPGRVRVAGLRDRRDRVEIELCAGEPRA